MWSVGVFYRGHQLSETQMFSLSHVHDKLSNKLVFQNKLKGFNVKCNKLLSKRFVKLAIRLNGTLLGDIWNFDCNKLQHVHKKRDKKHDLQRTFFSCFTSSPDLSMALAFLFLPTGALGRPPPTPFTSSLSGEVGLEPAVPLPLLIFLVSSFFGICSLVKSSLSSSTHSSSRLLTKTQNRS